ncbi:hypothetical protein L1F34_000241 [Mammaliicoccus lentus]
MMIKKIIKLFDYTHTRIIKIYSPDGYPYMYPDKKIPFLINLYIQIGP